MEICTVEGCEKTVKAKGLCSMHYQRQNRTSNIPLYNTKYLRLDLQFNKKKCNAAGCEDNSIRMGLCQKHLKEWNFE